MKTETKAKAIFATVLLTGAVFALSHPWHSGPNPVLVESEQTITNPGLFPGHTPDPMDPAAVVLTLGPTSVDGFTVNAEEWYFAAGGNDIALTAAEDENGDSVSLTGVVHSWTGGDTQNLTSNEFDVSATFSQAGGNGIDIDVSVTSKLAVEMRNLSFRVLHLEIPGTFNDQDPVYPNNRTREAHIGPSYALLPAQADKIIGLGARETDGTALDASITAVGRPGREHAAELRPAGGQEWLRAVFKNLPAGATDAIKVSVRIGDGVTTQGSLALLDEIFNAYKTANPQVFFWRDRRPFTRDFVSHFLSWRTELNPRGWDPTLVIDPNDGGRALDLRDTGPLSDRLIFHQNIIDRHTIHLGNVKNSKINPATSQEFDPNGAWDVQGIVMWGYGGEEGPHPIVSYTGDPSLWPVLAPELTKPGLNARMGDAASVMDDVCQMWTDQGYHVGFCLRSETMRLSKASVWKHNLIIPYDHRVAANELIRKVEYCYERWGAKVYYIDTFSRSPAGPTHLAGIDPYGVDVLKILTDRFPDCLFIPEHEGSGHYAISAPLISGSVGADPVARYMYPGVFGVNLLQAVEEVEPGEPTRPGYENQTAEGDVIFLRGWSTGNPENQDVHDIFQAFGLKNL